MKVTDTFSKTSFSVEIEPVKIGTRLDTIFDFLDPLVKLGVKYFEITKHVAYFDMAAIMERRPGQSIIASVLSEEVAIGIEAKYGGMILAVPHLTTIALTPMSTYETLWRFYRSGIRNVLALRGDLPQGFENFPGGHYPEARYLIRDIAEMKNGHYITDEIEPMDFCIGAACYPEGYKGESVERQIEVMKSKSEFGAHYFVSQMTFDPDVYIRFCELARKAGIKQPIVPGIKPLATRNHLEILPKIFGCTIPAALSESVNKYEKPEDIRQVGIDWAIEQIYRLRENGAPSIHLYAARQSGPLIGKVISGAKSR